MSKSCLNVKGNRYDISKYIVEKLNAKHDLLQQSFNSSKDKIAFFYIDDLLPEEFVKNIYNAFPEPKKMTLNKTLREYKFIAAQMDKYDPLLEEIIYAFQEPEVVRCIENITGMERLHPDEHLYAGGISLMGKDHYLNPHLDNSHDKDRDMWRVFNLLYYVSPDWSEDMGGNLELWPNGVESKQDTITSKCNRLVVMATDNSSWHSVSPILADSTRCCVSNYYFSSTPFSKDDSFHVTTFRARPGQIIKDLVLRLDGYARSGIRKVLSNGIKKTTHVYKKK